MTSPPPLLYDTYYHIYSRGNNRGNIFFEARNYEHFINLYFKYLGEITELYAYCLLKNHFHLLMRIKAEQEISSDALSPRLPSKKFSDLLNAYARAVNKAYVRTGSLFEHPFGRVAVTSDRQFWNVIAYIHQNPQRHQLVKDFREWKWSSYGVLLSDGPTKLARNAVMDWFGDRENYLRMHDKWVIEADIKWAHGDEE
jgi:REP element-mobilizing transposase RayT